MTKDQAVHLATLNTVVRLQGRTITWSWHWDYTGVLLQRTLITGKFHTSAQWRLRHLKQPSNT